MTQQKVSYTEPELCTYGNDMSKPWFVYFDFTDHSIEVQDNVGGVKPLTVRKQYRTGINKYHQKAERIKQGNALKFYLKKKLESGWNPITDQTLSSGVSKSPQTISDAIDQVYKLKSTSLKPKSLRNYKDIKNMFVNWLESKQLDKLPLHKFGNGIAQDYMDYLLLERNYSGKSHNGQLGILKAFCNVMTAKGRKWMTENPFACIETLPESVGRNIAYTEEEAKALMHWLKFIDIRVYYAANFMFHAYIRKTELCELKVSDIDWQNRTIKISSAAAKNRIQDSVTITDGLMKILDEMELRSKPKHYYIFGTGMQTSAKKIGKPDVLSDRHKSALDNLRTAVQKAPGEIHENSKAYRALIYVF